MTQTLAAFVIGPEFFSYDTRYQWGQMAAHQRITMHLRKLGLIDRPYTHRMTVNGVSA